MTELYYVQDAAHGRRGPFTLGALLAQPFEPDTLISRGGSEPWLSPDRVPELAPYFSGAAIEPEAAGGGVPAAAAGSAASPHWAAPVCNAVIALNVLVYVAFGLTTGGWMEPRGADMIRWGADVWHLTTAGQWWRLMTAAFLHFGLIHLLANMYALFSIGWLVERVFGSPGMAVLYVLGALISSLASVWWDRGAISAGASGAVFAVYGALLAYLVVQRASFPQGVTKALLQSTLIFVGFNVVYGLTHRGISNSAHIGGLVAGMALGAVMARPLAAGARRTGGAARVLVGAGVGVAALAVGLAVMPKADPAEQRFVAARKTFGADEGRAVAAYNRLVEENQKKEFDDAEFANRVERDVIPVWRRMVGGLTESAVPDTSPSRALYEVYVAYAQYRLRAYEALVAGLRSGDEGMLKQYKALYQKSEETAEQFKAASKNATPED